MKQYRKGLPGVKCNVKMYFFVRLQFFCVLDSFWNQTRLHTDSRVAISI